MKKTEKTAKKIHPESPKPAPDREAIAYSAYLIWENDGRPEGHHETHWLQAETFLRQ